MKIGFTTLGCDAGRSGIGRYAEALLKEFAAHREHSFRVYGHESESRDLQIDRAAFDWVAVSESWRKPIPSVLWHQAMLPRASRDLEVMFLPAGNRRLPWFSRVPTVSTVHDFSALHVSGKYDRAREFYIRKVLPALMRRLDYIITVSESTKKDIVEYCEISAARISVIPLAADHSSFYPGDREACKRRLHERYGLDRPFVLYISRIEHPGKNHVRLIQAFARLREKEHIPHELVLVGPDRERAEEVRAAAAKSSAADAIRFFGFVDGKDLRSFYTAADVFAFPSLYEGFGLPLLEAMSCGTPVVCSNLSSLPEVAGDAALLFDPTCEEEIAASIAGLLHHGNGRAEQIGRGLKRAAQFNWRHTADLTLKVLEQFAVKA